MWNRETGDICEISHPTGIGPRGEFLGTKESCCTGKKTGVGGTNKKTLSVMVPILYMPTHLVFTKENSSVPDLIILLMSSVF